MTTELLISLVGLLSSTISVIFAAFAFKRSEKQDFKKEGKNEGVILTDIGYIKACVDRMEKNLNVVDERYQNIIERLTKVESTLSHTQKWIDEMIIVKEG